MPKGKKPALDSSDGDEDQAPNNMNAQIAHTLATNPALLQAVQNKLNGLVGASSGYIENLPQSVKRRLNALKNLQVEYANIEGNFYKEVHALEIKYSNMFEPLFAKRKEIVNGHYEPTDEEAKWVEPGLDEDEDEDETTKEEDDKKKDESTKEEDDKETDETTKEEDNEKKVKKTELGADKLAEELQDKATIENEKDKEEDVKGIREFWLTAMKNVEMISDMIQPHDEPILEHLTDMKLILNGKKDNGDDNSDEELGFALEFHFSSNDYFSNSVLTKSYKIQCHPDSDDPFSFDGTEITGCTGCNIDWKKGKNVTQKTIKKKQKHKGRGQTRTITKTVKNDSFFNFFDPPDVESEELEEDTEALLAADFDIGHFMRERLIPRAVLYFTGEAIDDDDDDNEFEDGDDDDGDDDELDDDEDPDYKPSESDKPPECKQQ